MKTLYLDCRMGAAGDMLAGALTELLEDPAAFLEQMNNLGIPDVTFIREPSKKGGITGTHISVRIHGREEHAHEQVHHGHDHQELSHDAMHSGHDHQELSHDAMHRGHDHHHHVHRGMDQIEAIISQLTLPPDVGKDVRSVYRLIAEAESNAHGQPVSQIHFHEVGAMDAIADIAMVCMLLHTIAPERIIASPVHVGSGQVSCAHGILPVPAPATAFILRGIPIYGGQIDGELCTPTGAALLKHFVDEFGDMPVIEVQKIGYGMGTRDFPVVNCVRAMIGNTTGKKDEVCELSLNIDDITPEQVGFSMDCLFEAGALEVYTVPVGMKKSRPGLMMCVMCRPDDRDKMVTLIFKHTTTLGIRESISNRYVLNRRSESVDTPLGTIRKKISEGYGTRKEKYEFDDLSRIAKDHGLSINDVLDQLNE